MDDVEVAAGAAPAEKKRNEMAIEKRKK